MSNTFVRSLVDLASALAPATPAAAVGRFTTAVDRWALMIAGFGFAGAAVRRVPAPTSRFNPNLLA